MKIPKSNAFTLIELLVVISIIAILAGIALPVFGQVQIKGAQTKALSNAKQIATACKLYAIDNSGLYPSYQLQNGKPASPPVDVVSSNDALCQLIPDYIPGEDIFWLAKSKWCNATGPDNKIDNPPVSPSNQSLATGENEWAYVLELTDTSNSAFPLIADGFTGDGTSHTYDASPANKGGVWSGKQAIVVKVDTSAAVVKCDRTTYKVAGYNGSAGDGLDMFAPSTATPVDWLAPANKVVNPK